jgi:hypothetical protein
VQGILINEFIQCIIGINQLNGKSLNGRRGFKR